MPSRAPNPSIELAGVRARVAGCTSCGLSATRTLTVAGEGPIDAAVMFVGEAPGKSEDLSGMPFMGQSGRVLDSCLAIADMARDRVFVTSILKCRPPKNRNPHAAEVAACRPHLESQIAIIAPAVVCTLGNAAARAILGPHPGIMQIHGQARVAEIGGIDLCVFPLHHPAATLYARPLLQVLENDVRRLADLVAQLADAPDPVARREVVMKFSQPHEDCPREAVIT